MNREEHASAPVNPNEKQLLDTINSYRTLIAASGIGAWEYVVESGRLNCNDIYFDMLGKAAGEKERNGMTSLQEAWADLLHPEDSRSAQEKFRLFVEGVNSDNYDNFFRLEHPDRGWIWIWSRGKLLRDDKGNPERAIGTHLDVTAQKEAEVAIVKEQLLLRTLIDNLPDIIYVKDDQARKVIANLADVRSIGAGSEADVIGKTDLELLADELTGRRCYEDDLSVLRTGRPILNKEESFNEGGNFKWLQTSKIPVYDQNGKVIRLLGIGHNITQRKADDEAIRRLNKELEEQALDLKSLNHELTVRKEQELEKALAQGKFEIASEVLHDIGNALVGFSSHLTRITKLSGQDTSAPLQSLALFLNTHSDKLTTLFGAAKAAALTDLAANIAASQAKNNAEVNAVVRELFHIVSHVQEILNIQRQFVRGQAGKHDRKLVDLSRIVEDCRAMMNSSYVRNGIDFSMDIHPGSYFFNGDPTKLMQVMLNIKKNAMEAIPQQAEKKEIRLKLQRSADFIELELTDTGIGFDSDTANHLFERGFTTKENGTGLGLYNCRSIIESHQGTFTIVSEGKHSGSKVVLRLPATERPV